MKKATVAIVGRPNVGKSTLFNYISGSKISIVSDTPGVTRDRVISDCSWLDKEFRLIDTGGYDKNDTGVIADLSKEQISLGINQADVIIWVVNVKDGITPLDREILQIIRPVKKPIVLCVNKVDDIKKYENYVYEFYEFGIEDVFPVSSVNRQGLGDMLDKVVSYLPEEKEEENHITESKVAIIGRPNAGKSSLVNALVGENRVIVSDVSGTTRDAIDTEIIKNDNKYTFIDTAGLRRKSQITEDIELFSYFRSEIAIDRADIAIVVIDANEGLSKFDETIAGMAHDKGKGIILAINKWDLIEKNDKTMNEWTEKIKQNFSFISYANIIFISAKTNKRVDKIYEMIDIVRQNQTLRIKTGVLNEVIINAVSQNDVMQDKGKRLRIYYSLQVGVEPPTFKLFVNDRSLVHFTYLRYLENKLREAFGFNGTSIKFILQEKKED